MKILGSRGTGIQNALSHDNRATRQLFISSQSRQPFFGLSLHMLWWSLLLEFSFIMGRFIMKYMTCVKSAAKCPWFGDLFSSIGVGTGPPLLRRVASGRCATGRVMIEESPQRRTRAAMMVGFRGRAADANVTAALTVCHERWLVGFDELVKIYETHVAGDVRPPDQDMIEQAATDLDENTCDAFLRFFSLKVST